MTEPSAPIYVFIGTKAQYIKTAPLLRRMQSAGIPYFLIDSGQHAVFTASLRKELGVKEPDAALSSKGDISSVTEAIGWFLRHLAHAVFRPGRMRRAIFPQGPGVCVIHGDTPSTLLALLLAKRAGMRVAHLEAGLRSYKVFKPFPEELIRIICMRFSDILFCPSDWALRNLEKMKVRGRMFNVRQNTNVEALFYSLSKAIGGESFGRPYALMTVHRVETILNRKRLTFVVELAERIAKGLPVAFVIHDPTRKKLEEFDLLHRLESNPGITCMGLIGHSRFLSLVADADFVVSDGGSIQEECYYLDVPCLVMRGETERMEGFGKNARLGKFHSPSIESFLAGYAELRTGRKVASIEPSKQVLKIILREEIDRQAA